MLRLFPYKTQCLKLARERLLVSDVRNWKTGLEKDGRNENNGNKLKTYRTYKTDFSTEFYVNSSSERDHRRIFSSIPEM